MPFAEIKKIVFYIFNCAKQLDCSMEFMAQFFRDWDSLEAMHPFGVMNVATLFMQYGIPDAMAFDIDEFLFFDLMWSRISNIRRIKVEARVSRDIFWVYVDLDSNIVSFQTSPVAPLTWSVTIRDGPNQLVRIIVHYHRSLERRRGFSGRCLPNRISRRSAAHRTD